MLSSCFLTCLHISHAMFRVSLWWMEITDIIRVSLRRMDINSLKKNAAEERSSNNCVFYSFIIWCHSFPAALFSLFSHEYIIKTHAAFNEWQFHGQQVCLSLFETTSYIRLVALSVKISVKITIWLTPFLFFLVHKQQVNSTHIQLDGFSFGFMVLLCWCLKLLVFWIFLVTQKDGIIIEMQCFLLDWTGSWNFKIQMVLWSGS